MQNQSSVTATSEDDLQGKVASLQQGNAQNVEVEERKLVAFEGTAEPNSAAKGEQAVASRTSMQSCIESSVRIVKGEIHNVLSLMRLNRRYNSSSRFHREIPATAESPLVRGLKHLHETLASFSDIQDMDTLAWLRPFLDVIESPETSGPITGGALSSLSKFLHYGFIHPGSPRAADSVCRICRVVTRCRFERTDHSGDEVVLVRILQVLNDCLRCPAGDLLTDQNVWDMVQSCYDIGRQPRLSELLQRTAEHMLTQVVLSIFARFSQLQSSGLLSQDTRASRPLRNSLSLEPDSTEATLLETTDSTTAAEQAPPYGLPCMLKILEFLCRLTNLGDNADTPEGEARRMLGLSLVNVVLETGGKQLSACNPLVGVIQHDLSRNLLQNSRTHNLQILSLTLRVVFNMFNSVREHMKVQLEVFFNSIHLAESSQQEAREMALESLVEFCREPQLMVDIYTNYDCDVQCTNLFEDMCKFLSKNTFPLSGSLNALNLLSLEGLFAILRSLADSCGSDQAAKLDHHESKPNEEELSSEEAPNSVEQLRLAKQRKKRLAMGAEQFNRKPTKGLEFCQSLGLLPEVLEPVSIGAFLRTCPGLDKTAIGLYLGEPDDLNLKALTEFTNSFDFTDMELGDALRGYLATFRLPGESQKIARIIETFAARYFAVMPGPFASADTVYILSYAIIMLNTDLHNVQVKKKMTKEDFLRMNRGINDNKDLPAEFLSAIYDNICKDEIKMSEDLSSAANASGGNANEPRWDDLLTSMHHKYRNRFAATLGMSSVHARDMFLVAWDGVISALSVVFETTEDEKVLRKTIEGFHNFSKICSFHGLHDEFNKLVSTLAKSLYKFAEAADANRPPDEDPNWLFVKDAKVKIAAHEMFAIAFNHADGLRDGWACLLDYVARLHRLKALPASLMEGDDFADLHGRPLHSASDPEALHRRTPTVPSSGGVGSFFRSISYLWGAAQAPRSHDAGGKRSASCLDEPGNEELATWVGSLRLEELLGNTKFLSNEAVSHLVRALVVASSKLLDESSEGRGVGGDAGGGENQALAVGEHFGEARTVESSLLALELLTSTAVANAARAPVLWPSVHAHMRRLLDGVQEPNLAVERTVVNQLRLCLRLMASATPEEQQISADLMDALRQITLLPAPVLQSLADRISQGLLTLIRANAAHIRQREDWETVVSLLQQFAGMAPPASTPALEAMSYLLREEGQVHVSVLNFDFLQQTLLAFVDAVLSPGAAKQHAAAATGNPSPTAAEIRRWQQQTAGQVMGLMYALFVRLRCWQGMQPNTLPVIYHVGGRVTGGYHTTLPALPAPQQQQQQQQHQQQQHQHQHHQQQQQHQEQQQQVSAARSDGGSSAMQTPRNGSETGGEDGTPFQLERRMMGGKEQQAGGGERSGAEAGVAGGFARPGGEM